MDESINVIEKEDIIDVEWPNHGSVFIECIWKLFSKSVLFDLDVTCAEKTFSAHSVILAALCEIIDLDQYKSYNPPPLKLDFDGVNDEVCKCFLEFIYRGKTCLNKNHLQPFLAVLKQAGVRGLDRLELNNNLVRCNQSDETDNVSNDFKGTLISCEINEKNGIDSVVVGINESENSDDGNAATGDVNPEGESNAVESLDSVEAEAEAMDDLSLDREEANRFDETSVITQMSEMDFDNYDLTLFENHLVVNGNSSNDTDDEVSMNSESQKENSDGIRNTGKKVKDVCSSVLKNIVDLVEENEQNKIANVDSDPEIVSNEPSMENCSNDTPTDEDAVHSCNCCLNLSESDGHFSCSIDDALAHCECRLMNQEKFDIVFGECEIESEHSSCECSHDINVKLKMGAKSQDERTEWYLEKYVADMLDVSLANNGMFSELDSLVSKYEEELLASVPGPKPIQSTKNRPAKPQNTITSNKSIDKSNQNDVNKSKNKTFFICQLCSIKVYGVASLGLHMISTHHYGSTTAVTEKLAKPSDKVVLSCGYCSFKANSKHSLACHLTDVHKNMILTPDVARNVDSCSTASKRVTRSSEARQRRLSTDTNKVAKSDCEIPAVAIKTESTDSAPRRRTARVRYPNESEKDEMDAFIDERGRYTDRNLNEKPTLPSALKRKLDDSSSEDSFKSQPKKKVRFDATPKILNTAVKVPKTTNTAATTSSTNKEDDYVCKQCNFTTASRFASKCHVLEHVHQPPYLCVNCRAKYNSKSGLIMHMMKHYKPTDFFQCGRCSYESPWKTHMDNHLIKIHDVEVTFICHICEKSMPTSSSLDQHRRAAHYNKMVEVPGKKFMCPKCKYEATDAKQLYRHVFEKHVTEK